MEHLEAREWKLRTHSNLEADEHQARITELQLKTGLSAITLRACLSRGLDDAGAIQEFLNPRLETLTDPSRILDMDKAVERLSCARKKGETIRIFGDYDVDGTTGAALLSWLLRDYGFKYEARQPDRFKDGYGLNVKAVEEAAEAGASILLTVDCGISSFDAGIRAGELGIDLIVVDHHQVDTTRGLPQAFAIINPQRTDCPSELKQLCGCGLAFYLGRALRTRGRAEGWWPTGQEPNLKQHPDLVVLATAADMVPLLGDNHALVRHGLEILKQSKKPGVKALMDVAGLTSKSLSPGHLGFVIGPRINASGRMGSASLALELLTTHDPDRAMQLARELEKMNEERAATQNRIWDEVRAQVEKGISEGRFKHGIVVADPGWHEGVVGIVASRVTETFRKPAAVIALREDFGKGSVRSFGGKDVLGALRECTSSLLGFGGHRFAAGLSVALDRVLEFADAFDQAIGRLEEDASAKPLMIEGDCTIEDLDIKTLEELEALGPFGPGNPEPVFSFRASVQGHQILKGRHLKMNLAALEKTSGDGLIGEMTHTIEAIWFHAAERQDTAAVLENSAEWAGVPELNRFRGRVTPTFRVRDWRILKD